MGSYVGNPFMNMDAYQRARLLDGMQGAMSPYTQAAAPGMPRVFNGDQQYGSPGGAVDPTMPRVFNGDRQYAPAASGTGGLPLISPVRDDVVRGMGGSPGGPMPSAMDFISRLGASRDMSFTSGSGQIGNGLNILGHPAMGYTAPTQSPVLDSDHRNAGLSAYTNLLSQHTTGPDSPSQATSRIADLFLRSGDQGLRRDQMNQDAYFRTATHNLATAQLDAQLGQGARRAEMERQLILGGIQRGLSHADAVAQAASSMRQGYDQGLFHGDSTTLPLLPQPGMGGGGVAGGGVAGGMSPALGAPLPPAAPTATGGPPALPPPALSGATPRITNPYAGNGPSSPPIYEQIQPVLDSYTGGNTAQGQPGNPIGTMLARLDRDRPGFVQQHWPAIQAYLQTKYGPDAFTAASAGVTHSPLGGYIDPAASRTGLGYGLYPLVGGLNQVGNWLRGNPGMNEDQQGRAMLANLLQQQRGPTSAAPRMSDRLDGR